MALMETSSRVDSSFWLKMRRAARLRARSCAAMRRSVGFVAIWGNADWELAVTLDMGWLLLLRLSASLAALD